MPTVSHWSLYVCYMFRLFSCYKDTKKATFEYMKMASPHKKLIINKLIFKEVDILSRDAK